MPASPGAGERDGKRQRDDSDSVEGTAEAPVSTNLSSLTMHGNTGSLWDPRRNVLL